MLNATPTALVKLRSFHIRALDLETEVSHVNLDDLLSDLIVLEKEPRANRRAQARRVDASNEVTSSEVSGSDCAYS